MTCSGQPNVDEHNWRANTEYRGVYTDSHQVMCMMRYMVWYIEHETRGIMEVRKYGVEVENSL